MLGVGGQGDGQGAVDVLVVFGNGVAAAGHLSLQRNLAILDPVEGQVGGTGVVPALPAVVKEVAYANGVLFKVLQHGLPQGVQVAAEILPLHAFLPVLGPQATDAGIVEAQCLVGKTVQVVELPHRVPILEQLVGAAGHAALLVQVGCRNGNGGVAPLQGLTVFQGVGDIEVIKIAISVYPAAVLLVYDGLVEGDELADLRFGVDLQSVAVVSIIKGRTGKQGRHVNRLHIAGVRYPVFVAEPVQFYRCKQQQGGRAQKGGAFPAVQHPEGLAQQHLGHQRAHHRPQYNKNQKGGAVGLKTQNSGGSHAQTQAGAHGYAHLEQRTYQGDGHHVAGGLHMADLVYPQGCQSEHHRNGGVDEDSFCPSDGIGTYHSGNAVRQSYRRPLQADGRTGFQEHSHRGEPLDCGMADQSGAPVTVIKFLQHCVNQIPQNHSQKVQDHIKGGQGQQISSKHGAEGSKGEEKQPCCALYPQPGQQYPQIHAAVQNLDHDSYAENGQIGQQQKGQTGEVVGAEQSFPVHGQGVHHAGAAAKTQVAEYGHSGGQTEGGRQHHARLQTLTQRPGQIHQLQLAVFRASAELGGGGEKLHGDHKSPDQGINTPDGPESDHVFLKQGTIIVRCHGPHSPHLPIHR